jgi:predicted permease
MPPLAEFYRRLLYLFRKRQFDRDLAEEMRFHLERKAADVGPAAARRRFGNLALLQEDSRAAWGLAGLERLLQDVRYAARGFRKTPGFTAVVILTLALGIGVNTAIFGFVDRLILRPLPFPQSDRLATIYFRTPSFDFAYNSVAYPVYRHYRDHNDVFSDLAAFSYIDVNLGTGDRTESVAAEIVTANYFPLLGVAPILGRSFLPEEDAVPGRNPVAMLSAELWRSRFAGDPAILGRRIAINGTPFTVVGIVPAGFTGIDLDRRAIPRVWVPTMTYPLARPWAGQVDLQHHWGNEWLSAVGRLKPDVTFAQANARVAQLTENMKPLWRVAKQNKDQLSGFLIPSNESRFPPHSRKTVASFLAMLMAVVSLILLIACSNVASLMLARAVKRQREIGIRLAIGAGRARLAQQLLTEGVLISLAGGVAGLAVAVVTARLLAGFGVFSMQLTDTAVDARVLAFALGLSVLTGIVFGVVPLRQAARAAVTPALQSGRAPRGSRARNVLIVAQVALSLVLLAAAGLFVRTLRNARATDPTRDPERVLLLKIDLASRKYDAARGQRFYGDLLDRLHSVPAVRNAALVMVVPYGGRRGGTNIVPYPGAQPIQVDFNRVSTGYFRTIGLLIVRGRGFDTRDRDDSAPVVMVNEPMARRFWPGEDPIGKRIEAGWPRRSAEVVGVVRDGRFRGYREQVYPCYYEALAQSYIPVMHLEVRAAGSAEAIAAAVRHEILSLDKDLVVAEGQTLRAFRDAGLGQERLSAALLGGLGLLGALIAAIGLYGVLAFSVAQRTREIGIRIALGAAARNVLRAVLAEALALVAIGVAVGLVAARLLARFVSSLLYGVSAADPATYAVTVFILIAAGALAAFLPARRAARVDPIVALRYE